MHYDKYTNKHSHKRDTLLDTLTWNPITAEIPIHIATLGRVRWSTLIASIKILVTVLIDCKKIYQT